MSTTQANRGTGASYDLHHFTIHAMVSNQLRVIFMHFRIGPATFHLALFLLSITVPVYGERANKYTRKRPRHFLHAQYLAEYTKRRGRNDSTQTNHPCLHSSECLHACHGYPRGDLLCRHQREQQQPRYKLQPMADGGLCSIQNGRRRYDLRQGRNIQGRTHHIRKIRHPVGSH